jgi:hypothetical protein
MHDNSKKIGRNETRHNEVNIAGPFRPEYLLSRLFVNVDLGGHFASPLLLGLLLLPKLLA